MSDKFQIVDKNEVALNQLMSTIRKIEGLVSPLGAKWKAGMSSYYYKRLAELTLTMDGGPTPTDETIEDVAEVLRIQMHQELFGSK